MQLILEANNISVSTAHFGAFLRFWKNLIIYPNTNGFCLQIKGENVRIKARRLKHPYEAQGIVLNKCRSLLYFILTASNAILFGVYLLPHYISISMY